MKSRGVYETPGGAILYKAINVLETITLDKESSHFKAQLAQKYADIVYNGQWFTPLREALDAFADSLEKTVTGDVKLKLYKGNMINAGVTSPYTLYDEQTASFGEDDDYNQADSAGFFFARGHVDPQAVKHRQSDFPFFFFKHHVGDPDRRLSRNGHHLSLQRRPVLRHYAEHGGGGRQKSRLS